MDQLTFFAYFFVLGTIALYLSMKRKVLDISSFGYVFFMIRSRYFIPLIDWIARLAPSLWKFLADFSVVVSFGGLGAAYLSKYRRESRNLDVILLVIGTAAIVFGVHDLLLLVISFVLLAVCMIYLNRARNPSADFVCAFILMTIFFLVLLNVSEPVLKEPIKSDQRIIISTFQGAFGLPPLLLGMFMIQASDILFHGSETPGISPMIPHQDPNTGEIGVTFPGYIDVVFIPLGYAIISIAILLFVHEGAHGVLARAQGIKLKSTGLLTFGIIPVGAFVEPDDADLEARASIEKMRVFTAGSFANLIVGLVSITAFFLLPLILLNPDGVSVNRVYDNSSLSGVIPAGTVIYSINGQDTKGISGLNNTLSGIPPGSQVTLLTGSGSTVQAVTTARPNGETGSFLGVEIRDHNYAMDLGLDLGLLVSFITLLWWIFFFNINIALVNILPIAPFDGWRMLKEVMNAFRISELTARRIVNWILAFSLFLLLLNALPLVGIVMNILGSLI